MNIEATHSVSIIWIELAEGLVMRISPSMFEAGPGSSVGIATDYGPDGPGIESLWGLVFPPIQTGSGVPPSLLYNGYRAFPGGKVRPGRAADPSPPSSAVVME